MPQLETAPKADRELATRIEAELARGQRPGLRGVQVDATRGIVTLRGSVHSFYERQLAIQCCRAIDGIRRLIDAVEVG